MLPSKIKPLKSRKSSTRKQKGKAKASSDKPSASKKPRHDKPEIVEKVPEPEGGSLQEQQGSASRFDGLSSSRRKVTNSFSFYFVLL